MKITLSKKLYGLVATHVAHHAVRHGGGRVTACTASSADTDTLVTCRRRAQEIRRDAGAGDVGKAVDATKNFMIRKDDRTTSRNSRPRSRRSGTAMKAFEKLADTDEDRNSRRCGRRARPSYRQKGDDRADRRDPVRARTPPRPTRSSRTSTSRSVAVSRGDGRARREAAGGRHSRRDRVHRRQGPVAVRRRGPRRHRPRVGVRRRHDPEDHQVGPAVSDVTSRRRPGTCPRTFP